MGASLALAGLSACTRQPTEHIMPYVRQPEELIPGRPLFFATATTLNGVASGVLAESHEGRPTKIEGNPGASATLGACDIFSQASVLQLYDPDRSQALTLRRRDPLLGRLPRRSAGSRWRRRRPSNGAGIRILTETVTSPTMADQFRAIQKLFPAAKWHQWEPAGPHSARAGAVHGLRPAGQHLLQPGQRQRGGFARFRFPRFGPGQPALCARSSRRGGACAATRPR